MLEKMVYEKNLPKSKNMNLLTNILILLKFAKIKKKLLLKILKLIVKN